MPERRVCETCRWHHLDHVDYDADGARAPALLPVIECRRYPPTMVLAPDHHAGGELGDQPLNLAMPWPMVEAGDWCGEWSSDGHAAGDPLGGGWQIEVRASGAGHERTRRSRT